jgi:protein-tyrosine-phosphatase
MSVKRIIVVCKYNQARSITAAAALRRFFPKLEILSAGIQANPLVPIPSSILQILDQWDLNEYDVRSTPVVNLPSLTHEDLVLCADAEIRMKLIEQLGIKEADLFKIKILEEFANSSLEIPVDPVNMGEAETKNQLVRSVVLSVRGVRRELGIQNPVTKSIYPRDRAEHIRTQQQLVAQIQANQGVILDAGFSIPNRLLWQPHNTVFIPFNPNDLAIESGIERKTGILISKFEVDFVPKIFLSKAYLLWLQALSQHQNIYVLAQPAGESPHPRQHEAILALLHS